MRNVYMAGMQPEWRGQWLLSFSTHLNVVLTRYLIDGSVPLGLFVSYGG